MTKRSKSSLERRMAARKTAHRFGVIEHVTGSHYSDLIRYTRVAGLLTPEARAEFEADRQKAAHCPKHGELRDPAVLLIGEGTERRVAFCCPHCSGPDLLAQWEREGAS